MNPRSWIEIDKNALLYNISSVRKLISPKTKLLTVLKANAYGHGLLEVSSIICNDVDWIGVDNASEALKLRSFGIKNPVLILGYTQDSDLKDVINNDTSFICYSIDQIDKIRKLQLKKVARLHIKLETGLNRQGISRLELTKALDIIKKYNQFQVLEGLSTHYSNIEDTIDSSYPMYQFENFKKITSDIKTIFPKVIMHTAASAGTLLQDFRLG